MLLVLLLLLLQWPGYCDSQGLHQAGICQTLSRQQSPNP